MNQRMSKLYKQALEFAYENVSKEIWNTDIFHAIVAGKFAEMIVGECIQRLIDHSPARFTNEVAEEEWDKGYDQAMEDSVNHIKEHFGVEQ